LCHIHNTKSCCHHASCPAAFGINGSRLALDPNWLNVQANSNTVNVSDTQIEFGFGELLFTYEAKIMRGRRT